MWETTNLGSEDLIWAATAFNGGIASQRDAVCGALSGATIYLGLKHRTPLKNNELAQKAKDTARQEAAAVLQNFQSKYGTIICKELVGIDFSNPVAVKEYRDSGKWINCCSLLVQSVITQLYDLETK
jgi:C_GCAxxG_C_C family probable redox protein